MEQKDQNRAINAKYCMFFVYTCAGTDIVKNGLKDSRNNKTLARDMEKVRKRSPLMMEAKALPTNDARVVVKFLKNLFSRFGTPRAIISDRGTHFCNDQFAKFMLKYGVTHRLSVRNFGVRKKPS